jgi:hypothetical protein
MLPGFPLDLGTADAVDAKARRYLQSGKKPVERAVHVQHGMTINMDRQRGSPRHDCRFNEHARARTGNIRMSLEPGELEGKWVAKKNRRVGRDYFER